MAARFAPVDLTADVAALPDERAAGAGQAGRGGEGVRRAVPAPGLGGQRDDAARARADESPLGRARLHYFLINKGPWSRLDHNEPFVAGRAAPSRRRRNFYPAGATKEEVEAWLEALSPAERDARHRVLHHDPARRRTAGCIAVPYSLEYQGELAHVAALLREAAALTTQPTLKALSREARGGAPRATTTTTATSPGWSSTPASSRPSARTRSTRTSGSTTRRRSRRSSRCATTSRRRSWRASAPSCRTSRTTCRSTRSIRNPKLGALAPIRVVNTVFSSGDANRGVQTAAFNLPNDERVIAEKGSKRVMLKNNQEAKFRMVLQPIAKVALVGRRSGATSPSTRSSRTS